MTTHELIERPTPLSIKHARDALRNPIFAKADDNMDRAVASAIYRQQNSEIARCFLRLVATLTKGEGDKT